MKSCPKGHCREGVSSSFAAAFLIFGMFLCRWIAGKPLVFSCYYCALSLPSFKHKWVCARWHANSSGRQRSQWFTESENHCKLPWLCAGLGWSNCPAEGKEAAIFPYPLARLPAMGICHCTQWEWLLIWYSQASWGFTWDSGTLPWNRWFYQHTLHALSSKSQMLVTSNYFRFWLHADLWVKQCLMQLFDTYVLLG